MIIIIKLVLEKIYTVYMQKEETLYDAKEVQALIKKVGHCQ